MTKKLMLPAVLLVLCFLPVMGIAQEVAATLNGNVTDSSGAIVQGAKVTIHSLDTNADVRTITTGGGGNYTATNIPAGNYTVTVESSGFKTYTAKDVVLNVAQHRTVNAQLQPGQVSETMTVQEAATPVQTSNAAQSTTITGTQVRELQLNNRNFEQLTTLQPGVVSGLPAVVNFGISNTNSIVVNGARTGANNWTVDGADINDSGSNLTLLNVPSVDAIQEFTMQRSTYDAQFGRSGGGQVLVATRSGTTAYHGDVYEFVRNDIFNANDFFSNLAGRSKPPLRYNDYGFTVGGPIFIPKVYSKSASQTFFFWSEEWRKTGQPSTFNANVPTQGQLAGTFAGTQLSASSAPAGCVTNTPAGGQVNPTCFSQNAKAYLANVYSKFPANAGNGTQYISNVNAKQNFRQDLVRLDQNVGSKLHIFGRYMQDVVPTTEPGGLFAGEPLPGISSTSTNAPGKNVVANVTWTLSPTVVNEAAFNYSWGAITSELTGVINSPAFNQALAGGLPYTDTYGRIPGLTIAGLTGVAIPAAPYFERNIDKNFYDNFSLVHGNQTIRAGVSVQWMKKTENAPNPTNGTFTFRNAYGNPAFANFLLGNASQFSDVSRQIIPDLRYNNIEGYVQDDVKVTPHFTLNFGLRYSFFPSPSDNNNTLNNFDPTIYSASQAPAINPTNGQFVAGQSSIPARYVNGIIFPTGGACTAAQTIAPVTCSPYGNLVNPNSNNNFGPRVGFAWDPYGNGKTSIRGGYGIYYDRTLNGIWEQNAFVNPPLLQQAQIFNTSFDRPTAGSVGVNLGPANLRATGTPTFKVPSYQNYNFSIQREVFSNTVLELAYVGNQARHLLGDIDLNQPTLAARRAVPTANVNAVRPYVGYGAIVTRAPVFISNYNSLQVSLNHRVANGLTFGLSYTYSKNLTNNQADRAAGVYNTYDFRNNYGPAFLNTPHVFVANYVYDLPFFRSQRGVVGHILGGWEVSGITSVQSGQSLTITQSNDPFNSDDFGAKPGTYPGGIGIDPSSISPRPDFVAGTSLSGPGTVQQYFNTAALTEAVGHFGNAARGVLLGPGLQNWDISGIRNIKITERFRLQFRGEFFNTFNHANFTTVSTNINSSTFGRLTNDRGPRQIQFGLKLYF